MVEIDSYPRQVNKIWSNNSGTPIQFLMTRERTQVLDLLVHLITNSTDSIVVCGPEGVGKTGLLRVLQHHETVSCIYSLLEGNIELNLDKIKEQLTKTGKQDKFDKVQRTVSKIHGEQAKPLKKTVLIIDNAGALAPGMMTAIIRYVGEKPHLRVIFVLTHDQLYLKYKSDQVIDDCHIVELPPFSEEQCGKFLQHLAATSSAEMPADLQSESVIADIYRRTHGIPARIIAEFSGLPRRKHDENPTRILVMAVAVLVVVALSVQWLSSRQTITAPQVPAAATPKVPDLNLDQVYLIIPMKKPIYKAGVYLALNIDDELPTQGRGSDFDMTTADSEKNKLSMPESVMGRDNEVGQATDMNGQSDSEDHNITEDLTQPASELSSANEKIVDAAVEDDASRWLTSQPENNYTLQLMVLSKRQSILDVMKKYPALQQNFRYFRRLINGKEKFVLLYGSFSGAGSANKTKQTLPPEFRKSLTRKISAIINEFGLAPTDE